ncbi:MAG: Cytosolic Fe-S cluster assembly factor nar1 [Ramalina farinacea]|uniref:Cytosolic Fe-S cluster assembly factor NAR1 n=1 Tax=Ramalina farinacea TaxID=258253 RepID=A0AA43TT81_9LECA|nr:Cytosolic Fe-S cluster assembly factor nar1 [Ramalina farinacea]
MSAILSADDLNDFISPGVACIKPVETLPKQRPDASSSYEVAKEGQLQGENAPAQISLTDCLACSGCVTSAEAILVSLQSHAEVLNVLDTEGKLFVASVSPQVRASIAATYDVSEGEAGCMIQQLLAGPDGLSKGGKHGNAFKWVLDTNAMREASLVAGAEETTQPPSASTSSNTSLKRPIISSACPGWICYAEKQHPHILPHLSPLKSPQALTGTLLKSVLSKQLNVRPDQIWHVAVMPCFDKKLEASREELTDTFWRSDPSANDILPPTRDVDCVITARELLMLADTRGISFPNLPRHPPPREPFPDPIFDAFFYPHESKRGRRTRWRRHNSPPEAGSSGGYLHHILQTQLALHPGSQLTTTRGRNADQQQPPPLFKAARYYGFHNIQNLVRKMAPAKKSRMPGARSSKLPSKGGGVGGLDFAYVEVMACPGGCTNGGGQIKVDDLPGQSAKGKTVEGALAQKEWLGKVDEAYFSMSSGSEGEDEGGGRGDVEMSDANDDYEDEVNGISPRYIHEILGHWEQTTGIPLEKLMRTTYRAVESDVGKVGGGENERALEVASKW